MYDASVDDDADLKGLEGETDLGNAEIGDGDTDLGNEEIGNDEIGNDEIGSDEEEHAAEVNRWMRADTADVEVGNDEIYGEEIGDDEQGQAVRATIKQARDNRQPAPKMQAVAPDAPLKEDPVTEWLSDVFIGAAMKTGKDEFPLTTQFLLRAGGGQHEPRYVRVDTEQSYAQFRTEASPELAELHDRVVALEEKFHEHLNDPNAHHRVASEVEDIEMLGADVKAAEDEKKIDLWLSPDKEDKVPAWREGDLTCVSLYLPGSDGELRICTAIEPSQKGINEMARHAREANVDGAAIIGVLPAMGCVLGAATMAKEIASAAPSILARPEADSGEPFIVRIEPKSNPALCALAALLNECKKGNAQACDEWKRLAKAAKKGGATAVAQAMIEAQALLKKAA